jgi:chromosome segregation ATPase
MMEDERYDIDYDYKNKVNVKYKAIKEIIKEKKEKEKELEKQMDDTFIIQKLNNEIEAKVYQLKNLTREYRLKKLDKDTFTKLKKRYKKSKEALEKERAELKEGLRMWLQELIVEKNDLQGELALFKGRYKSKEIGEEEYESKKEDLEYQLKKTEAKIETVEKLIE